MELLFFSSDRCAVCRPLREKLEKLSDELGLSFREIKIEESPQEAAQRLVLSAPTLILEDRGREVRRWSGVFSPLEVEEFLRRLLPTKP